MTPPAPPKVDETDPLTLPAKAQDVMEAAGKLFLQQGYGATSMDEVARSAGVSKATLYAHFSSKENLFAALVRRECTIWSASLWQVQNDAADVEATLLDYARRFEALMTSARSIAGYRIIAAEAGRFPQLGQIFYEAGPAAVVARLAQRLAAMAADGLLEIDEPEIAANQFLGMLKGDNYLRRLFGVADAPHHLSAERIAVAAVRTFLRAYGPRR